LKETTNENAASPRRHRVPEARPTEATGSTATAAHSLVAARSPHSTRAPREPFSQGSFKTLFHEDWWLAGATGSDYEEVTVHSGPTGGTLPFVVRKRRGFTELRMPPFTHVLGPLVTSNSGKYQTKLQRRLSTIRELIKKLPKHDYFKQSLDSHTIDALAFQEHGFRIHPHYTFEIDCSLSLDEAWKSMNFKVRQHIRRAEERFRILPITDCDHFKHFYLRNMLARGLKNRIDFRNFSNLYGETQKYDAGIILGACWPNGRPAAMVFLVWGHGKLYYLMSTRASDAGDNGSVNLLIWSAIQHARQRGLTLDLDGVITSGTARFLNGFGGRPKARLIVERSALAYGAIQDIRAWFNKSRRYDTFT
jgi:hypothetical protein